MSGFKRVVTGVAQNGRSMIVDVGSPPKDHDFEHLPGQSMSVVWRTTGSERRPLTGEDPTPRYEGVIPGPGETVFLLVSLPPAAVLASDDLDRKALAVERAAVAADLFDLFEPDHPGFHTTPTLDYVVVLEGELLLEVDESTDGGVRVGPGDVIVQNGTRHAWRNPGESPARFACVLIGVDVSPDRP